MSELGESHSADAAFNRIYFHHIPKTAGTAFSQIFRKIVSADNFFEHMESRRELLPKIWKNSEGFFVSGHLAYESVETLISQNDVFSITVLRNPVEQLISHIKWVKAYGAPDQEKKRASIEPQIAKLSIKLWNTSLNDVGALNTLFDCHIARMLFDNLQVRYLCPKTNMSITSHQTNASIINAKSFDFVFVLEDMDKAIKYLNRMFSGNFAVDQINTSPIDEAVDMSDPKIAEFYKLSVRFDARLFSEIRKYSRDKFFVDID